MIPSPPPQTAKATIKYINDNATLFTKKLTVSSIRVEAKRVAELRKAIKDDILCYPRQLNIIKCTKDPSMRWILLKETKTKASINLPSNFKSDHDNDNTILEEREHCVEVGFDSLSMYDILRPLIPEEIEVPTSFEGVGHIAHLNLKPEQTPYKSLIGHVLILKNTPKITIVVNKIGSINNVFRFFNMEVIARRSLVDGSAVVGDELVVQHQEDGVKLSLDYSKVYWNSKLQHEHSSLVDLFIKDGQSVCDMFCGVGPFVLQCLNRRKDVRIWANDLNPESVKWLKYNLKRQRGGDKVKVSNVDARLLLPEITTASHGDKGAFSSFDHYILNLPASSTEFLDVFSTLTEGMVHCYLFATSCNALPMVTLKNSPIKQCQEEEAKEPILMVETGLGRKIGSSSSSPVVVRRIRNVAPKKEMYCVSFCLGQKKTKKAKE